MISVILGVIFASSVQVAAAPRPVRPTSSIVECTESGPRPCIVSATRNGESLPDGYRFVGTLFPPHDGDMSSVMMLTAMGPDGFDLGFSALHDVWQINVDTGNVVPRIVSGRAAGTTVLRSLGTGAQGGNLVTVTGKPVTVAGTCDRDNYCPEWSESTVDNEQFDGYFDISINDVGNASGAAADSYLGVDYFSNVAVGSVPPVMRQDQHTGESYMYIELANRHYLEDGVTEFKGVVEIRIPDAYLRREFGIPDPETMPATGLTVRSGGDSAGRGTMQVERTVADDGMSISLRDLTFSRRVATVRVGDIRPTRPKTVAVASAGRQTWVTFSRSRAQGAHVTGYEAMCDSRGGRVRAQSKRTATVMELQIDPARVTRCRVRATSSVGSGKWSRWARPT